MKGSSEGCLACYNIDLNQGANECLIKKKKKNRVINVAWKYLKAIRHVLVIFKKNEYCTVCT